MKRSIVLLCSILILMNCQSPPESNHVEPKSSILKALIIDGENNHGIWPKTTMMMKSYLEETGLFEVEVARKNKLWLGPHYDQRLGVDSIQDLLTMYPLEGNEERIIMQEPAYDSLWNPDFAQYDVVVSNMGWKASEWPAETKKNFETYMREGGGLVVVHAANNSWGDWDEFNKMIGLGGWGGRTTESGPYVYYDQDGVLQRDVSPGPCGFHGPQHEFQLETRAPDHPIMKGLPARWLHTEDELYDRMRGPAENMTILATAFSDTEDNAPPWDQSVTGTGRHEPMLMTIDYGKGRIFHTALGHMDYSMSCVGFISTLQRGTEWAATGDVTQAVPDDFPSADATSARDWRFQ